MWSLKSIKAWVLLLAAVVVTVTVSINYPIVSRMTQHHQQRRHPSLATDSIKPSEPRSSISRDHLSASRFSRRQGLLARRPSTNPLRLAEAKSTTTRYKPTQLPSNGKGYHQDTIGSLTTDADIDYFTGILTNRLNAMKGTGLALLPACTTLETVANSCDGPGQCLRMERPKDIRSRVAQLMKPNKLHIRNESLDIIQEMRQKVKGHYDIIIATAASSNHYLESQAMIKNLHDNVFPLLKNFTFLFYNIGLTKEERTAMVKYCKCQVLDYPFEKFPVNFRYKTCYTWKPMIIKAHYHQTKMLLWADASMRFPNDSSLLQKLLDLTRERGVQVHGAYHVGAPFYTNRTMYHFFGDEPCMYLGMTHGQPSCIIFARDRFVEKVILEPWVACAMDKACMCLTLGKGPIKEGCEQAKLISRDFKYQNGTIEYGTCHLFDQSAISLIIHKLYQEHYRHITTHFSQFHVYTMRGDRLAYFPEQEIHVDNLKTLN